MKYLKYLFSCKHPAWYLRWDRGVVPTITGTDPDFEDHSMCCHCDNCGKDITLAFIRCRGGVSRFLRKRTLNRM